MGTIVPTFDGVLLLGNLLFMWHLLLTSEDDLSLEPFCCSDKCSTYPKYQSGSVTMGVGINWVFNLRVPKCQSRTLLSEIDVMILMKSQSLLYFPA